MKLVLRRKHHESNSYRYIINDDYITVKRFESRKEALQFLKHTIPKENFKLSDWECITLKQFEEELSNNAKTLYNALVDTKSFI